MKRKIFTIAITAFMSLMMLCTTMNVEAAQGTLQYKDGKYYYMVDGKNDKKYNGFVEYQGGKFLVANGKVATHIEGLAQDPKNPADWYYLAAGQVCDYTGLALYDGAWFYVDDGRLDTSMNAVVEYDGGLFLVAAGQIKTEVNGLVQDPQYPDWWYFVAAGQVQAQYSGLALYDGQWFYVEDGVFQNEHSGYVKYQGELFYVRNGQMVPNAPELAIYRRAEQNRITYSGQITAVRRCINGYRANWGENSLALDEELCIAAGVRAQEMADYGYLELTRPNGDVGWESIAEEFNLDCNWIGENIAMNYSSAEEVCSGWWYDDAWENMVDSDYTKVGIGLAYDWRGIPYWVAVFTD